MNEPARAKSGAKRGTMALVAAGIVLGVSIASALYYIRSGTPSPSEHDWPAHGGDAGHTQFSRLSQITPANVRTLQVAWTYHTGDAREGRTQIQCNPIVVKGTLYATSPQLKLLALDAATGRARWIFDPFADKPEGGGATGVNRGVVFWEDENGGDARILYSVGARLFAIDAATGKPVERFGANGSVNLHEGLGRDVSALRMLATTPGTIYKDLLILGSSLGEGPGPAAPGHIRAYDVRTGAIRWIFHTIPHPGEPGHDSWPPDAWTRAGGANSWSGLSVDVERGLAFVPTGSAAFDFWGGNRPGANLYANSLVALDARTGKHVWHYQFIRHDIWDRDLPQAPVLVTVQRARQRVDAVAQVTKTGHIFLFNRDTGEPLFPIEEHPAPTSDLEAETTWPTQPLPTRPAPFARQTLAVDQLTTLSPEAAASARERFLAARSGHLFTPPSTQGSIVFPGFDGGGEWGGSAYDPRTGRLYVNGNNMAWILRMVKLKGRDGKAGALGKRTYDVYCGTCHGANRQGEAARGIPSLDVLESRLSRADVARIVEKGRGAMAPVAITSQAERDALVAYLFNDARPPAAKPSANDPAADVVYTHTGYNRFLDAQGYPAIAPPWGTLNAIDLTTGDYVWTKTFGEYPELTKRGIPQTGMENYGGPVVTASGLLFIGATKDEKFRAYDAATGERLWETTLPAAGHATPATYAVGGRQFVVIAAGGGKGTKSGDAYVAFALPN
jgi:quinoprotein glucose dehydrogenase